MGNKASNKSDKNINKIRKQDDRDPLLVPTELNNNCKSDLLNLPESEWIIQSKQKHKQLEALENKICDLQLNSRRIDNNTSYIVNGYSRDAFKQTKWKSYNQQSSLIPLDIINITYLYVGDHFVVKSTKKSVQRIMQFI